MSDHDPLSKTVNNDTYRLYNPSIKILYRVEFLKEYGAEFA